MEEHLSELVSQGRTRVAVLDYLGSFCPITLGHVQCLVEAHKILTGDAPPLGDVAFEPFAACIALMRVNSDCFVSKKLADKGEKAILSRERLMLCGLATSQYPWVHCEDVNLGPWLQGLQRKFECLQFFVWCLNGADDVVKYEKWLHARADSRYITMGRPGHTKLLLDGLKTSKISADYFLVGSLDDSSSSTDARVALTQRDTHKLAALLHPSVTAWCQTEGPWRDDEGAHPPQATKLAFSCSLLSKPMASLNPDRHRIMLTQRNTVTIRTLAKQIEKLSSQRTPPPPLPTDEECDAAKNLRVNEVVLKFPTKDELIGEYVRLMHTKKEEEEEVPTDVLTVPDYAGPAASPHLDRNPWFIAEEAVLDLPHLNAEHWARVCKCLQVRTCRRRIPLICIGTSLFASEHFEATNNLYFSGFSSKEQS
jgi:hypothetical protein